MTTLDVPCSGRATFHRLTVPLLRQVLLTEEARLRSSSFGIGHAEEAVETYLRPVAYMARRIGE